MLGRRLLTIILTTIVPTVLLNVISYATNHFKAFFFEALFLIAWISLPPPDHHCSAQAYQLHLQGNRHSQLDGNAGSDHIVYRGELSELPFIFNVGIVLSHDVANEQKKAYHSTPRFNMAKKLSYCTGQQRASPNLLHKDDWVLSHILPSCSLCWSPSSHCHGFLKTVSFSLSLSCTFTFIFRDEGHDDKDKEEKEPKPRMINHHGKVGVSFNSIQLVHKLSCLNVKEVHIHQRL